MNISKTTGTRDVWFSNTMARTMKYRYCAFYKVFPVNHWHDILGCSCKWLCFVNSYDFCFPLTRCSRRNMTIENTRQCATSSAADYWNISAQRKIYSDRKGPDKGMRHKIATFRVNDSTKGRTTSILTYLLSFHNPLAQQHSAPTTYVKLRSISYVIP